MRRRNRVAVARLGGHAVRYSYLRAIAFFHLRGKVLSEHTESEKTARCPTGMRILTSGRLFTSVSFMANSGASWRSVFRFVWT